MRFESTWQNIECVFFKQSQKSLMNTINLGIKRRGHYSAATSSIVLDIIGVSHVKRTTFCAWVVLIHADSNGPPCGFVLRFFSQQSRWGVVKLHTSFGEHVGMDQNRNLLYTIILHTMKIHQSLLSWCWRQLIKDIVVPFQCVWMALLEYAGIPRFSTDPYMGLSKNSLCTGTGFMELEAVGTGKASPDPQEIIRKCDVFAIFAVLFYDVLFVLRCFVWLLRIFFSTICGSNPHA